MVPQYTKPESIRGFSNSALNSPIRELPIFVRWETICPKRLSGRCIRESGIK
jgi:hypothetical protein